MNYKEIDIHSLKSKLLKEYLTVKSQEDDDSVLLFQVGGFYETYFDDARIFSQTTGAMLSSRTINEIGIFPQAGVPIEAVFSYVKKLLEADLKVVLCSQYKNENNEFSRHVSRRYTKGTIYEEDFLDVAENNYILALYKKENSYLLSYCDVSTGQFYKTSGDKKAICFEVDKITPQEVLIFQNQKQFFKDIIDKYNTTLLEEAFFEDEKIENTIIKYCNHTQKDFLVELDKTIEYKIENYMLMDEVTRRCLELSKTRRYLKHKGSVLWFLNYTKTPMGLRLLKKCISEPLLEINEIIKRQNAISELIENENILNDIQTNFETFCDLSRCINCLSNSTIYPRDLYKLTKNASKISQIHNLTQKLKSDYLKIKDEKLNKVLEFVELINNSIDENSSNNLKEGNIIKEGYNSNLDYLRNELKKTYANLYSYIDLEKKRLEIKTFNLKETKTVGFCIEVPKIYSNKIPKDYYLTNASNTISRYSTNKLRDLEKEIFNLKYQISEFEYQLFCDIRNSAKIFVSAVREIAKDIAKIDVLSSFAKCAIINHLVKPSFHGKGLAIKNGFHPSLLKLNNELVKNDTNLEESSMIILTGANMSGKSTYLKSNAIICLLAQIGAYVPCDSAKLSIFEKLFFRQGSTDDIINNNSSFMVEMNDLKFIVDNLNNSSLVLLDEPAKSTNSKEGGVIARAFCEYLLSYYSAKTIIATHNTELTKLEDDYPDKAINYVMGMNDDLNYVDRKIVRGKIETSFAINTAILSDLPDEIIKRAQELMK